MTSLFNLIVDDYQILDSENRPVEDIYTQSLVWLDNPGCLLQPGSFDLPAELRTHAVMKPGLYMTIVLEGTGESFADDGPEKVRYTRIICYDGVREPTPYSGGAPRGPIRAVGAGSRARRSRRWD